MKQDRVDQLNSVQVQSCDPIGVVAGQADQATGGHPQREVAPQGSFQIAWALTH